MKKGDPIINIDKLYFRPTEVDELLGDPSNAKNNLGWEPKITLKEMVSDMIDYDIKLAAQDQFRNDQFK
jgi:GDPmannose 4,6-dehydratase